MLRTLVALAACVAAEVHNVDAPTLGAFLEKAEDKLIILDFYAPWCGHCKRAKPHFVSAAAKLAQDGAGGKLAAVDCTKVCLLDIYPLMQ